MTFGAKKFEFFAREILTPSKLLSKNALMQYVVKGNLYSGRPLLCEGYLASAFFSRFITKNSLFKSISQ